MVGFLPENSTKIEEICAACGYLGWLFGCLTCFGCVRVGIIGVKILDNQPKKHTPYGRIIIFTVLKNVHGPKYTVNKYPQSLGMKTTGLSLDVCHSQILKSAIIQETIFNFLWGQQHQ